MSFKRSIVSLGFLAVALAASPARAQDCKADTDCRKGFVCELTTATPPPVSQPAPAPTCKAGTVCPVSDPAPTTNLVAPAPLPTTGICREASCKTDADCGASMVCHGETIASCSGGTAPACPPNADCIAAKPAPDVCTTTTVSTCVYKWQLPCNVDNDCGVGFACKPTVSGSCSGSGGTPVSGGSSGSAGGSGSTKVAPPTGPSAVAPVPPDTNCTTTTSFPGYCEPKATTCAANTECPADWTCEANSGRAEPGTATTAPAGTTSPAPGQGVATDVAIAPPGGGATIPAQPVTMSCVSPLGVYATRDTSGSQTGGGTTGPGMTPAPTTPTAGGNPGGTSNEGAMPSAGCAVGGSSGGPSLAFALLGVLGLALSRRRR